jgi:hypothetical protein
MKRVPVERDNLDRARVGINQPVLAHPGTGVQRSFGQQVVPAVRRAEHFNEEIRRLFHTTFGRKSLTLRQEDDDIWLYRISSLKKTSRGAVLQRPPRVTTRGIIAEIRFAITVACAQDGAGISYSSPSMIS